MGDLAHETADSGVVCETVDSAWNGAAFAGGLAVFHLFTLRGVVPVDDDYIVYRYARNLLEHGEYAFNAGGPATDGVTSPFWLLTCVVGLVLGISPEVWTLVIGTLSFAALAGLAVRAGHCVLPRSFAIMPGLLVAISPAVAWHARAGLGTVPTAVFVAAATLAWLCSDHGRSRRHALWAGAFLGAAAGFRLEVLVLLPPLVWSARHTGNVRALLGVPLVVLTAVCAWRIVLFGTPVPATATLKALPLADEFSYGAAYLGRSLGEGGLALFLVFAALFGASTRHPLAPTGRAAFLALCAIAFVGGDWMVYGRFLVPFVVLGVLGAAALFAQLNWKAARGLGLGALMFLSALGLRAREQAVYENSFFERWWLEVGDVLRVGAPPDATFALSPIGAIGWRSERGIVDVLGLTHHEFHGRPADLEGVSVKGHHRHDGAWVLAQRPDYLLLGNAVLQPDTGKLAINPWEADIVSNPQAQAQYVQRALEVERPDGKRQTLPYFRLRGAPDLRPPEGPVR